MALLGNAAYRIGSEYLVFVNFRDGVRDAAMFKARNDDELSRMIVDLADEYEVPVGESDFEITRKGREVAVAGHYNKPVEILPRLERSWPFSWDVNVTSSYVVPAFPQRPKNRR